MSFEICSLSVGKKLVSEIYWFIIDPMLYTCLENMVSKNFLVQLTMLLYVKLTESQKEIISKF